MKKEDILSLVLIAVTIISVILLFVFPPKAQHDAKITPIQIYMAEKVGRALAPTGIVCKAEEPAVIQEPVEIRNENSLTASMKPVPGPEPVEDSVQEAVEISEPEPSGDRIYLGTWTVTAYCGCQECCGSWAGSPTASGAWPAEGWTAAADLPFGTMLEIEGVGVRCVEDRGVYGEWIDVYFDDHDAADSFGMQYREVWLIE